MILSVFCRGWRILVLLLASIPSLVNAVQLVSNSSIPANLTDNCISALHSDVNCSPVVAALRSGSYYTEATLKSTCTTDCRTALSAYESRIVSACGDQTWNGYEDTVMPVVIIPDMLFYLFNLTCLMDSNRYCNNVAAKAALTLDPGSGDAVTGGSIGNANSTGAANGTDRCDLCFIKNLQFQAGSPYYDGPLLAEHSVYQSKTSSCGISGYPLTTSDLSFYTPTASATATPTACAGKAYSIQPNDDCHSISISQGIGTGWLLYDNDLQPFCAGFPKTGSLCLMNTCRVYTVQKGDTCKSIAAAQKITASQLKAWNAVIDTACYNIDKMNGSQVCVSAPGTAYVTPTVTVAAPTVATTAAPAPSDVVKGTNQNCGRYYQVKTGDYCNMIVIKFGITLSDFVFLNPTINQNCTNLFAAESYCVQAVGDVNTYSGRAGFSTPAPTPGTVTAKFSDLPDATYTSPITSSTSVPFADGTRSDCNKYFDGDTFQKGVAGTNWNSECQLAAAVYDVDLTDFGVWNTGLGNVTLSTCSFQKGVRYCGKLYFGSAPDPPPPSSALPIRDGATPNCTEFVDVNAGWTCQDVLSAYDLTIAQFFAYNSAVKSDCSGLWTDYQYCIRTLDYVAPTASTTTGSGTTTGSRTTTSDAHSGALKPTSPVQTGQPTNCNKWYTAKSGDSCASIENTYFITNAQFHTWNPAISTDCSTGFWAGYAYCVGTTDVTTTRSSSSTPTPLSSSPAAPTPNQAGNAISTCNKYAATQGGDYCSLFATRNSISTVNLYAWNSVLGSDGAGCASRFWAGYYYCVGVSS